MVGVPSALGIPTHWDLGNDLHDPTRPIEGDADQLLAQLRDLERFLDLEDVVEERLPVARRLLPEEPADLVLVGALQRLPALQ